MIRQVCVGLIWIGLVSGCWGEPDWYRKPLEQGYASSDYFVATGYGRTAAQAMRMATAEIAGQIETHVSAKTTIRQAEDHTGFESHRLTNQLSSRVHDTLHNIRPVKQERDNRQVYVLAVIDKKTYVNGLRQTLEGLIADFTRLQQSQADRLSNRQFYLYGLGLSDQLRLAQQIEAQSDLYHYFSDRPIQSEFARVQGVHNDASSFFSQFTVSIVTGNNQLFLSGQRMPNDVVVQLQYNNQPVPTMPLDVRYSDGTVFSQLSTDRQGMVRFNAFGIPFNHMANYLTVQPQFKLTVPQWRDRLPQPARVSYRLNYASMYDVSVDVQPMTLFSRRFVDSVLASIHQLGYVSRIPNPIEFDLRVSLSMDRHMGSYAQTQYLMAGDIHLTLSDSPLGVRVPFRVVASSREAAINQIKQIQLPTVQLFDVLYEREKKELTND